MAELTETVRRDFEHFVNLLGGPERMSERATHQRAGMTYVVDHREEIYRQYPGEWIAANEKGVVAHASNLLELKERVGEMAKDPSYKHLAPGGVYIEYCTPQERLE